MQPSSMRRALAKRAAYLEKKIAEYQTPHDPRSRLLIEELEALLFVGQAVWGILWVDALARQKGRNR